MIETIGSRITGLRAFGVLLLILLFAVVLAPAASADTYTYTYTGQAFTTDQPGDSCSGGIGECSITGFFTLSTPLASNVTTPELSFLLTTFSFSDGVNTFTSSTLPAGYSANFELFASNASGVPTGWYLLIAGPNTSYEALCSSQLSGGCGSYSDFTGPEDEIGVENDAFNQDDPGYWTVTVNTTSPTSTPEPSSLLLLASGLAGLGLLGRKKLFCGQAAKAI